MRSLSSLLVLACALVGATNAIDATEDPSLQSLNVFDIGEGAESVPVNETEAFSVLDSSEQSTHRQLALRKCRPVAKETFKNQITSMCTTRTTGFSFYYKLSSGEIKRNCNCESFTDGTAGFDRGREIRWNIHVVCNTKTSLSNKDVVGMFNRNGIRCVPFDFEV